MFNVNTITFSGTLKMVKPNQRGWNLGIQLDPNHNKWVWVSINKPDKNPPFDTQKLNQIIGKNVLCVDATFHSYEAGEKKETRYTINCSAKKFRPSNITVNMGLLAPDIDAVIPDKRLLFGHTSFYGGQDKNELKQRSMILQWPENLPLPNKGDQVLAVGGIRVHQQQGKQFFFVGRGEIIRRPNNGQG